MTKKKNEKIEKEKNEESFLYKYKNDKKYKAKIELTGYVVFILLIIIFVNIASLGNERPSTNLQNLIIPNNPNNINEEDEEKHLLDKIDNNYQYDININLIKITDEVLSYRYHGKSYDDTLEINKEFNNTTNTYYKVDKYYYKKDVEDYIIINEEEIYDSINSNYIELEQLLDYLDEASLDHVTNYSSGKKEYVYNLYIRDIIINNKTDDLVTINITEENEILSVNVDYINLIKQTDNSVKECKVNYTFSNIDKIEDFFTLEENKESGEVNE